MKILFATMQFGRGYHQGTERYLTMLTAGLAARGHCATILAGDPEHRGLPGSLGDPVPSSSPPQALCYPTGGRWTVAGLAPAALRPLLEREQPDVVHLANPAHIGIGLLAAARAAGLPTVVTVVDYWWLCPKHTLLHARGAICDGHVPWRECVWCTSAEDPRIPVRVLARTPWLRSSLLPLLSLGKAVWRGVPAAELRRWTRRQAVLAAALNATDAVIFLSEGARGRIGAGLAGPRTFLIPVGMEARWFETRRAETGPAAPRDPANVVVGFAGALGRHKGPHLLLDALRRLGWTQTRVRIAGSGTDERYRVALASRALGLPVEFIGALPSHQMPAFLRSIDVLVVPSLWPENQPQTVLEALATNTPVLASRVDGICEVLRDDSLLFDANSAPDLARCLAAWVRAPRGAAQAASVSTADEMVDRTLAVYSQVSRPRGDAAARLTVPQ